MGWGASEAEAVTFGVPTDRPFSRFGEAFGIIRSLLRTGAADFQGDFYQVDNRELVPRGPRKIGPPLMVGVKGPKMLRLAAREADMIDCLQLDRDIDPSLVRDACREVDRDPSTLELIDTRFIRADDDQKDWSMRLRDLPTAVEHSAALGYAQVILWTEPNTTERLGTLCGEIERLTNAR